MIVQSHPTRDELIVGHMPLVRRVIESWWHLPSVRRMGRDEANSVGLLALVRAADTYESDKGAFVRIASVVIRNAILYEARSWGRTPNIEDPDRLVARHKTYKNPVHIGKLGEQLEEMPEDPRTLLMRRFGVNGKRRDSMAEIAASEGVSTRKVRRRLRQARQMAETFLDPELL